MRSMLCSMLAPCLDDQSHELSELLTRNTAELGGYDGLLKVRLPPDIGGPNEGENEAQMAPDPK